MMTYYGLSMKEIFDYNKFLTDKKISKNGGNIRDLKQQFHFLNIYKHIKMKEFKEKTPQNTLNIFALFSFVILMRELIKDTHSDLIQEEAQRNKKIEFGTPEYPSL